MKAQSHRTAATRRVAMTSRVTRAVGIATATVVLTAGCAAGQLAQTADQKSSIDGTNTSIGSIDIRAIAIQAPPDQQPYYRPGTAAPLTVVFVNNSRADDQLTGIKTAAASNWAYFRDYNDAHKVQAAAGNAVTGAPSPSPSEGESSSATASEEAPAPTGEQSITIPASGRVGIATPDSQASILLTGVSRALYPATTVNVTLTFAKAGTVTVAVPVQVATLGRAAEVSGGDTEEG